MSALITHSYVGPDAQWELFTRAPLPALACVLREPYYGYVESTPNPLRRREYPGVRAVLIIDLGPPLSLLDPADTSRCSRFVHGFVAGVRSSFALTEHAGHSTGIQVTLTPSGARRLFGLPMSELNGRIVGLEALLSPEQRALLERLVAAPAWTERFDLLDRLLLALLAHGEPSDLGIHQAMRAIVQNPSLNMAQLARELDVSPRRLIERFRDQVGAPPKVLARIARFEHAITRLRSDPTVSFGALAQRYGYADQAHLTRDFRGFAGGTPSEVRRWLAGTDMPEAVRPSREPDR